MNFIDNKTSKVKLPNIYCFEVPSGFWKICGNILDKYIDLTKDLTKLQLNTEETKFYLEILPKAYDNWQWIWDKEKSIEEMVEEFCQMFVDPKEKLMAKKIAIGTLDPDSYKWSHKFIYNYDKLLQLQKEFHEMNSDGGTEENIEWLKKFIEQIPHMWN